MNNQIFTFLLLIFTLTACEKSEVADTIFLNGDFYTVNENEPRASVIAVKDGRIKEINILALYNIHRWHG